MSGPGWAPLSAAANLKGWPRAAGPRPSIRTLVTVTGPQARAGGEGKASAAAGPTRGGVVAGADEEAGDGAEEVQWEAKEWRGGGAA